MASLFELNLPERFSRSKGILINFSKIRIHKNTLCCSKLNNLLYKIKYIFKLLKSKNKNISSIQNTF